jgi:hypothetical protein
MAINVNHYADPALLAQVAYDTGQGQYATTERQRAEELAIRQQQMALQDIASRRSLGQQAYQFDVSQNNQAAANQQDLMARMYGAELQQQGYADMRESDEAMQTERLQADSRKQRTAGQQRLLELAQERQYNTGLASAKNLEDLKRTLSPEQYQQARTQWESQFGDLFGGEYPFTVPQTAAGPDDALLQGMRNSLQTGMGDLYYEGMADDIMELPAPDRAAFMLDVRKMQSDNQAKEQQAAINAKVKEQEFTQDLMEQQETHQFNMVKAAEELKTKKAQDKANLEAKLYTQLSSTKVGVDAAGNPKFMEPTDVQKRVEALVSAFDQGGNVPQSAPQQSGPTQIKSAADYEALPSGTEYIDPNGVRRRKP